MLPILECSSFVAGKVSTILPVSIQESVEKCVNSAVVQCLNDCVRNAGSNIDAKETFKYHRDLHLVENNQEETKLPKTTIYFYIFFSILIRI